jgi:hypothetical protein
MSLLATLMPYTSDKKKPRDLGRDQRASRKARNIMDRPRSESRHLTKLVGVRLHPEDMIALVSEADRRGISVAEFLRDSALGRLRPVVGLSRVG